MKKALAITDKGEIFRGTTHIPTYHFKQRKTIVKIIPALNMLNAHIRHLLIVFLLSKMKLRCEIQLPISTSALSQ